MAHSTRNVQLSTRYFLFLRAAAIGIEYKKDPHPLTSRRVSSRAVHAANIVLQKASSSDIMTRKLFKSSRSRKTCILFCSCEKNRNFESIARLPNSEVVLYPAFEEFASSPLSDSYHGPNTTNKEFASRLNSGLNSVGQDTKRSSCQSCL